MAEELIPPGIAHDGYRKIVIVPKDGLQNPAAPTAAELEAGTAVTYSMPPDGFNPSRTQATEADPRLALVDQLESLGRITNSLTTVHLYGSPDDVMDPLIVQGDEFYFVNRQSVLNGEDFAAGQLVDVWGVQVGLSNKGATNGKQTKSTTYAVKSINADVEVVAGA